MLLYDGICQWFLLEYAFDESLVEYMTIILVWCLFHFPHFLFLLGRRVSPFCDFILFHFLLQRRANHLFVLKYFFNYFQLKMKPQLHYGEDDCPISAPDGFPKDDELHFEIELIEFFKAKVRIWSLNFIFYYFCLCSLSFYLDEFWVSLYSCLCSDYWLDFLNWFNRYHFHLPTTITKPNP